MRRKRVDLSSKYKIMVVDDEEGIIDSLSVILNRSGYTCTGFTDPMEAVERLRIEHYDLLILDYLMNPIHGDKVVEILREFDKEIYILLLTGHKDIAPPLETIKALDIQGYCEKSDKFEQLLLLIESGIKSVAQMKMISDFKDGLSRIIDSIPRIYQLNAIEASLKNILAEANQLVNSESSFVLLEIDEGKGLREIAGRKIFEGTGIFANEPAGETGEERGTEEENRALTGNGDKNSALTDNEGSSGYLKLLDDEITAAVEQTRIFRQPTKIDGGIVMPLTDNYLGFIGTIYIEYNETDDIVKLLEIFAGQVAGAISNTCLHNVIRNKNEEIGKMYEQLKDSYIETIEALRQAVDAKDEYTRGHSDRVSYYSVEIGKAMGLPEQDIETLRISGIFHDIGKISISDNILLKPGKLDESEFNEIRKHPLKSARILSATSLFKDAVPVIRSHHERIDGKGYPDELKGNDIPFLSRIIAVSDAFDAMMTNRSYRPRLGLEVAKEQLIEGMGTQFDRKVTETFINMLGDYQRMEDEIAVNFSSEPGML